MPDLSIESLIPAQPDVGPPLPRGLGVTWPWSPSLDELLLPHQDTRPTVIRASRRRSARPHNPALHAPYSCEELAGIRSVRRAVMQRVWEKVRDVERRGQTIGNREFGQMVEAEWEEVRQAAAICPAGEAIASQL